MQIMNSCISDSDLSKYLPCKMSLDSVLEQLCQHTTVWKPLPQKPNHGKLEVKSLNNTADLHTNETRLQACNYNNATTTR